MIGVLLGFIQALRAFVGETVMELFLTVKVETCIVPNVGEIIQVLVDELGRCNLVKGK